MISPNWRLLALPDQRGTSRMSWRTSSGIGLRWNSRTVRRLRRKSVSWRGGASTAIEFQPTSLLEQKDRRCFCHGFERRPPPCWLHCNAEGGEKNEPDEKDSRRRRGGGLTADGRCYWCHDRRAAGSQRRDVRCRRDGRHPERRLPDVRAEPNRDTRSG